MFIKLRRNPYRSSYRQRKWFTSYSGGDIFLYELNKLPDDQINKEDTIQKVRKTGSKLRMFGGINGLNYRPSYPVHDIYCEVIKEDPFFINRVPVQYLVHVLKEMPSSFFTATTLSYIDHIPGSIYNIFFKTVPLYLLDQSGLFNQRSGKLFLTYGYILIACPHCFVKQYCQGMNLDTVMVSKVSISTKAVITSKSNYFTVDDDDTLAWGRFVPFSTITSSCNFHAQKE